MKLFAIFIVTLSLFLFTKEIFDLVYNISNTSTYVKRSADYNKEKVEKEINYNEYL
jgi:hypothetical protein